MKKVLCIDFGWSSIKSVLITDYEIIDSLILENNHEIDIEENLQTVLEEYEEYEKIIVTGGRSHELKDVIKVNELESACLGALKLGNILTPGFVVNAGTGVSMTFFDGEKVDHMGGTSIGGGTIKGLGQLLLGENDFEKLESLALEGNIKKVNLTVEDIVGKDIGLLDKNMNAANFGKIGSLKEEDKALGIFSLVASSIASNAVQVARRINQDEIIVSGRLGNSTMLLQMINFITEGFGKEVRAIDFPEFATACGAYLAYYK